MQKLIFESAWDKTIAAQDRENIKQVFDKVNLTAGKHVQFTSLWQAKNHREELLVAVLIHNTSKQDISFHNQKFTYLINDKTFAEHTFSPPITIEKQTSMPWTFIFPAGSFNSNVAFSNGILEIE